MVLSLQGVVVGSRSCGRMVGLPFGLRLLSVQPDRLGMAMRLVFLGILLYLWFVVRRVGMVQKKVTVISLAETSRAFYSGKRVVCDIYVSGKSSTPYIIPRKVEFDCGTFGRGCTTCSLAKDQGGELVVRASSRGLLSMLGKADKTVSTVLRKIKGACETCELDVLETQNVEELRVSPHLDSFMPSSEYVSRECYYLGHGLQPNRPYRVQGYCFPDPSTQRAVLVVDKVRALRDMVETFVYEKAEEQLKIFRKSPQELFGAIYEDFAANVHRIVGREDLQVAFDLVFHSVLQFNFQGVQLRRGWTEAFILGDSGQGKTEMSLCLLNHYGLGDRVQGEGASTAGLIGGLEKLGDRWILVWGRIPQLDKRLLIIDEFSGVSAEDVAKMSDIRATGIAEITKIRTERASARTRLIMMSNTRDGQPLSVYNTGVEAILGVYGHTEDVRRLDFALCVASGEIGIDSLNTRTECGHTYTDEACRNLILWAWSRTPENVIISSEVETLILKRAAELAEKYSAYIPLVEPSDTRIKVARLSVACACRCFSSDEKGNVVVLPEHVDFIYNFIRRCYDSPFMSYDRYSVRARDESIFKEGELDAAVGEFAKLPECVEAARILGSLGNPFRGYELYEQLGIESFEGRELMRFLSRYQMIQTLPAGYRKQPKMNVFLRELEQRRANKMASVN